MYHYVYRITNTALKKHYYGKRSSKLLPSLDLGIKYFSSSTDKEFKQDQKDNPQNYKYKVARVFATSEDALLYEILLHKKFGVSNHQAFYNRAQQTVAGFSTLGYKHTAEFSAKISARTKGKVLTETHKANLRVPKQRTALTVAANKKRSDFLKGKPRNPAYIVNATKAKIKYANIYEYTTGKLMAADVCISYWAGSNGYNRRSLQRTALSDHTKASVDTNRHHHKGIYARYI